MKSPDCPAAPPFRLDPEPCTWHDDEYCHRRLTARPRAFLDALHADLGRIARGELGVTLPPKQIFGDDNGIPAAGDFRLMPCIVRGAERTTKTVKVVGSNFARSRVPGRMTVGRALLLDERENFVRAEFAAFALSSARTGACAALARRLLGGGARVTLYGAGPVGWYAAYYLLADGGIDSLRLIDPDRDKAERALASLAAAFPKLSGEVLAKPPAHDDTDIAVLATDSRVPFLAPAATRARLVISLGADSDEQSELDPRWAGAARIVTDAADSALLGDLARWRAAGRLAETPPDFAGLLRREAAERPRANRERIVFVSTGSALFDNLTIRYLLGNGAG